MTEAASRWQRALDNYRYRVDLTEFADKPQFSGWFNCILETGNRDQTAEFENRFRTRAEDYLEPWFEVVFWKLYGTKVWRDKHTRKLIFNLRRSGTTAADLWSACSEFVRKPTTKSFKNFQGLFWGSNSRAIAVAATFPAFLAPDRFPMVDTRVAKWVAANMDRFNAANARGCQLERPAFPDNGTTVLTFSDWRFVESWVQWCRATSDNLAQDTGVAWRARDVEMAVFQAWGGKGEAHPAIILPVLR
jgi:hypothetical protein